MQTTTASYNWIDKALAWGVHFFTATGLLTGFMALVAISAHRWREAMWWLIASLLIDGLDGTLARAAKVREVLPSFNGKNLDYVIDFATYAIIPTYFFFEAGLAEGPWLWICAFTMLIVSGFYYGKEGMVADEQYFVGFPVLWNIVVFGLIFVFQLPAWANVIVVFAFAILHFIPVKYAYPSRARKNGRVLLVVSGMSIATLVAITYLYPEVPTALRWLAIAEGLFFGGLGIWTTYLSRSA